MLYLRLQAGVVDLPPIELSLMQLTSEQEEALFDQLDRRGAFDLSWGGYEGLSNRERWSRLRQEGYYYGLDAELAAAECWIPSL